MKQRGLSAAVALSVLLLSPFLVSCRRRAAGPYTATPPPGARLYPTPPIFPTRGPLPTPRPGEPTPTRTPPS